LGKNWLSKSSSKTVSCELGLNETNPPTGSTQNRESTG
jgi:hypothetical protein